ncbi:type III-B CRISPR-associated protein Cas10/Cmr2 [Aerosakkonema sp. BLCC-F183]|uniref:type III-B CRISPR-associated protein Cas10/Cmr2 n=1 Tax=Aerosakkonema sp. BLCC-F183 TaxID=3342834 RepID=UPI0035B98C93
MSQAYWQAKIWGLLHDPIFKALHNNDGRGGNSFWQQLEVMQEWKEKSWNPEESGKKILEHIHLADYIASASDRGAIGSVTDSINYNQNGLEISHLLSGEKLRWKVKAHEEVMCDRQNYLQNQETELLQKIPNIAKQDIKCLFWWLWRCLPEAACQQLQDNTLLLMPAETRLPDSSIWSHASITAALAGALAGYHLTPADIEKKWPSDKTLSHPYLVSFSFTPVQELIKASRKTRDFWAGSWLLHYISATLSWKLALQYGPDTLIYPSLYQQPLIDLWLLQKYPEFQDWIKKPNSRSLLTAGFPNVLVLVLPKDKVADAMQTAKQIVKEAWRDLGNRVLDELQNNRKWMPDLQPNSSTWFGWLNSQWQTYWSAVPIGKEGEELKNAAIPKERETEFQLWLDAQNQAYVTNQKDNLFHDNEIAFLREAYQQRLEKQGRKFSVNVGSWWPKIFDQTRFALAAVKNARTWQIPTAFGPRSTISGLGPVVHPGADWITEGETKKYWQQRVGLFDGREQLNATEIVKRTLEKVLPELLGISEDEIVASYPDLTAGVAGYLKVNAGDINHQQNFDAACQAILKEFDWAKNAIADMRSKWGIPWIDSNPSPKKSHPRLLNAGWLVEDLPTEDIGNDNKIKIEYRQQVQKVIDDYYPNNNPADWYVLAAGDGDNMSKWLKGEKLKSYRHYIASDLATKGESFQKFLELPKRMGPSTHNALSRALLDFSNQLVPYLTEQRYAGRLIYSGGDDVLAYTNLWEWDKWLWDIRQCFRGFEDPFAGEENNEGKYFDRDGDYWYWNCDRSELPSGLSQRPLFTMGHEATISFGIIIAHYSVPLAIALENLWLAESEAKEHKYVDKNYITKDAVQVRIIYGNGNILKATAKFDTFREWQQLLTATPNLDSAIFEQAAQLLTQHRIPVKEAIAPWTKAFCSRRDFFKSDENAKNKFQQKLTDFIDKLWNTTQTENLDSQMQSWLKIAAFTLRNRQIQLRKQANVVV